MAAGNSLASDGADQQLDMMEASSLAILKRADFLDKQGRFTDSTVCYQEGLQLLMNVIKAMKNETRKSALRTQFLSYIDRAEKVKEHAAKQQGMAHHEQIKIENDSTGNSYESLFGRFLDDGVTAVQIDDPYVRQTHQIYNFLRFCELIIKKCSNIKFIRLNTSTEKGNVALQNKQKQSFEDMTKSLQQHSVQLQIELSETLHDREIRLDNGWTIKIGRGLDYFQPAKPFTIGFFDQDLRRCHETTADIFNYKSAK